MSKLQHQFHTPVAINMLVVTFVFMRHPNIYLLKIPTSLGVLQRTTVFADQCLHPVFSVCDQIKKKRKKNPKRKKTWPVKSTGLSLQNSMYHQARLSEECGFPPELGNSKHRASQTPSQSHSRHYAASFGELTSWLPTKLTEQN